MRWNPAQVERLVCPVCRGRLELRGTGLVGVDCGCRWPIHNGLPRLYREEWIGGTDRLMRVFYDGLPALHDPAVRYLLPLLGGGSEDDLRARYLHRLELDGLSAERVEGRPLRILEVSIGGGANLPLILAALASAPAVEYWGLDLAAGMLRVCRRAIARRGDRNVFLVQGDAHRLPFRDHDFDRVFHVGGIGGFVDPAGALAELARVARPGTPIVVVDEQLDSRRRNSLYHRAMFRLLTFYDSDPHAPVPELPVGAVDVLEEQISRFYYSVRFRMPS